MKPFFSAVKQFYLATLKKMFKKFPFGDTILKDLGIVQPNKTSSYTVNTVHRLAKRFPQIELASSDSLDSLAEDFLLSPNDLPPRRYYKDCDGTEKPPWAILVGSRILENLDFQIWLSSWLVSCQFHVRMRTLSVVSRSFAKFTLTNGPIWISQQWLV